VKVDVETRVRQGVKDVLEEILQEEVPQHLEAGPPGANPSPGECEHAGHRDSAEE
jgi:hypothetical protein